MESKKLVYFTWQQFDVAITLLAGKLLLRRDIASVYGVPRGGLVPAVALSHILGLPLTDHINSRTLVVDDISDSGKTLSECAESAVCTATLHFVRGSLFEPTFWVHTKRPDEWVVYPWERRKVRKGD